MSVSADLTQLAMVEETTPGLTPAAPVMEVARITSESLAFNPTTQLSNELNPARQVSDVIVSGGSSGGDIGFEMSRNAWFEMALAGCFGNDWDATAPDRLEVGGKLKTYTIEKRFAVDETTAPATYDYHRIVNSIIDSMTLTFAPAAADTGSITILGGTYSRDELELVGATYTDPGQRPVMVGSDVMPSMFQIDGTDYLAWCFSQVVIAFKNNGRAIECLGTLGAAEMVLGRFECSITMNVYAGPDTHVIMDAFLAKTELAFAIDALDSLGNSYWFEFDRCRIEKCTEVAGGTNQDVVLAVTLQALAGPTKAPPLPSVDSCVWVLRAPTVPVDSGALDAPPDGGEGGARSSENRPSLWSSMQEKLPPGLKARRAKIAEVATEGEST